MRKTVADLLASKGKTQLTMLFVKTPDEAAAADAAGIDTLSIDEAVWTPVMREAAARCFVSVGLPYGELATYEDYLRHAHRAMLIGGDCVYCAASNQTLARLRAEGIPVVGHVGLIPVVRKYSITRRWMQLNTHDVVRQGSDRHGRRTILRGGGANGVVGDRCRWVNRECQDPAPCVDAQCCNA